MMSTLVEPTPKSSPDVRDSRAAGPPSEKPSPKSASEREPDPVRKGLEFMERYDGAFRRLALISLAILAAGCGDPGVPLTHHRWSDPFFDGTDQERCYERELTEGEAAELLDYGETWWPWACPSDWLVRCVSRDTGQTAYAYEDPAATWLYEACEPRGDELSTQVVTWP